LIMSLSFFKASAFTVFDAGFALKTHGSFVKGFTPLRADLAGFFFNFKFKTPPSLKAPFFLTCVATTLMYASIAPFTALAFTPVVSDTERYAADAVMAFGPAAFIVFVAFIAFIAFMALGGNIAAAD
jgi:hypothetical protein